MKLRARTRNSLRGAEVLNTGKMGKVGKKFDCAKVQIDLLPWAAVWSVAEVLTFGAKKYDDDNWQIVPQAKRRYFAAALRHLIAWRRGEKLDPESGFHHLAHAACCVLFLLALEIGVDVKWDQNVSTPGQQSGVQASKRRKAAA